MHLFKYRCININFWKRVIVNILIGLRILWIDFYYRLDSFKCYMKIWVGGGTVGL